METETITIILSITTSLATAGFFLFMVGWKTSARFTKIETDIDWLKEGVKEIKEAIRDVANNQSISGDNKRKDLMGNASPLRLKPAGIKVLEESGMKDYVDSHESELHQKCNHNCDISAYEIQKNVFDMFDNMVFEKKADKQFKDYAFKEGMNIETIRRIGAVYFRDKCLKICNLDHNDVDKTEPKIN
jgi:hypothetical protein